MPTSLRKRQRAQKVHGAFCADSEGIIRVIKSERDYMIGILELTKLECYAVPTSQTGESILSCTKERLV
jgi:hypothetical protein